MDRTRVAGTVLLLGLAAAALWLGGADRILAEARKIDPATFALAAIAGLLSMLAWSESLYRLLEAFDPEIGSLRFRAVYFLAVLVRGIAPGGYVTGTPLTAVIVGVYADESIDDATAAVSVADFCNWIGSVTVTVLGFASLVATRTPARRTLELAAAAGVVAVLGLGAAAAIASRPDVVVATLRRSAALGRATVGRRSGRVRTALDPDRLDALIDDVLRSFRVLGADRRRLALALAYSHLGWLLAVVPLHLCLRGLGVPVAPWIPLFVVPVGGIAMSLSVLPGGTGGVEPTMIGLLALTAGVAVGTGATAVVLFRIATYWLGIALGVVAGGYLLVTETVVTRALGARLFG